MARQVIRGIRQTIPSGFAIGRSSPGATKGQPGLVPLPPMTQQAIISGAGGKATSGGGQIGFGTVAAAGLTQVLSGTGINVAGTAPSFTVNLQVPVTVLNGGTGAAAPGTALDNIGPFSSNGLLARTGAGAYTVRAAGQIPSEPSNGNANPGNIGEFIAAGVASGSALALVSGTAKDIASISLTAGDWEVEGWLGLVPGTNPSVSTIQGWVNSASVTPPSVATQGGQISFNFTVTLTGNSVLSIGRARFSLSATTTIFLSTNCAFSGAGATLSGYGRIEARRAR